MPTSSEIAIKCDNVTKSYMLGETISLQQTLASLNPFSSVPARATFRALSDVSFTVERGAFFGIVGANGSGKSTLTQTISGITVPDSGTITVGGRILPLLEVGAGFSEDLTGRENVVLLGAILGIAASEVNDSIEAILDFAGIHRHFDTQLKRFSSGMKARLSFATAVCFPADIYVFDEVLAVVDDDFRERCTIEMQRLHREGKTILFMSHDLDLVGSICSEGMWLDRGVVRTVGKIADVANSYAVGAQVD